MLQCPKCAATLPDGSTFCQFCRSTWAPPPGMRAPQRMAASTPALGQTYPWVWKAYYAIAGWWILNGTLSILRATAFATEKDSGGGILAIVFGALTLLIGLGLVFRIDVARNLVTFLCFVSIVFGILGIVIMFFFAPVTGFWSVIGLASDILDIGLAGLMIFVIGETDRAPTY